MSSSYRQNCENSSQSQRYQHLLTSRIHHNTYSKLHQMCIL